MNEINWTKEQWTMLDSEIKHEWENSGLAQKLIKKMELPADARAVSRDRFKYGSKTIDETYDTIKDSEEQVLLTKEQTEDADLGRCRLVVRRAAQRLARSHDQKVFVDAIRDPIVAAAPAGEFQAIESVRPKDGDGLVAAVAKAIAALEADGYRSGYVMIAGHNVYTTMHQRVAGAADLPRKAIEGLLDSDAIHRSSVLDANEALVLSLSGEEIDLAVAVEPTLDFRRVKDDDVRELRLYERFRPRFKQSRAAVLLQM